MQNQLARTEQSPTVLPPSSLGFEQGAGGEQHRSMLETAVSRQAQEVQAAMVIAKKFPRDQLGAYQRILRACERPGLAAEAMYAYPRGGQQITGPSIRLAEVLAQNWGNLDFGIVELEQKAGVESIVMSYCWDLETNTRQCKVFTVKHERSKRSGNEILTDPRDIYELVANQGARRLRACILGIIPGDVVDDAVAKCDDTLSKKDQAEGPLTDRIKKLALAFQKQGVTPAMMETRLGRKSEAWTEFDYSTLKKIFLAIRDGMSKKEDFFGEIPTASVGGKGTPLDKHPTPAEAQADAQSDAGEREQQAEKKKGPKGGAPTAPELLKTIAAKLAQLNIGKGLLNSTLAELGWMKDGQHFETQDAETLASFLDGWEQIVEHVKGN